MRTLKTSQEQEVVYKRGIPPVFTHYEILNASKSFHASGYYGVQLFQAIKGEHFEARQMDFDIKVDAVLNTSMQRPVLYLLLAVENNINCKLKGVGDILLSQRHFNFTNTPHLEGSMKVEKKRHYRYFGLHLPLNLLQELVGSFPILERFLNNIAKGNTAMLVTRHPVATREMLTTMNHILYNSYEGVMRKLYEETEMFKLMLLGLCQSSQVNRLPRPITLTAYDVEKVHKARQHLLEHIDDPGSIHQIAQELRISESKLRLGFRQEYGTTPFAFLLEARMDKAKNLLLTTDMLIQDIATMTGYNKVSNFTAAFTIMYGQPPGAFRKEQ